MYKDITKLKGSALDLFLVKLAGKYSIYEPGDIIFSEGDIGNTMLLILEGEVTINKLNSEKNQLVTIAIRSAGEFIGEMALVEESPRFATVIAKTTCKVLEITKSNFEKIIKEKPSFATNVLESLSNKLRESDSTRVVDLEKNNLELTESNLKLYELNNLFDSVIAQSPSAIILVTKTGDISNMNKSAVKVFGLNKDMKYKINDLFSNFIFSDCLRDLKTTWSGTVNGLRVGQDFPVFLTCTVLTSFQGELLYLVIGQDLNEVSGFTSMKGIDDRYINAKESVYELAKQFFVEIDILKSFIDDLLHKISDNNTNPVKNSSQSVINAILTLRNDTRHIVDTNKMESSFTFVDIRLLMKTILNSCQSIKEFDKIDFNLEVHKEFPSRVYLNEVSLQNVFCNLIHAASRALLSIETNNQYIIKINLNRSSDNRFSEIKIISQHVNMEPENIKKELNRYRIFGWDYIEQVIHYHDGEFSIISNNDNYTAITIRLP